MGVLCGAMAGGLFFYWIAGWRVLDPDQFEWLMKLDWRINFLGWHLFRNDPWHLPPGRIDGYLAGEGTTIGFTDSVPIAALILKPLDAWLPTPFQYFGLWLLFCFVMQGAFGALITRVFTSSTLAQVLGAMLFVLLPTLLIRVGHPGLTAHFLLLWALWLYLRSGRTNARGVVSHLAIGLVAGLTHPYLAGMTLAMLTAVPLRDRTRAAVVAWVAALAATVVGWWLAGFISVSSTTDLSAGGLGLYSMNLLSPITPGGWSTLLPEWPVAHEFQVYEGFQYLGRERSCCSCSPLRSHSFGEHRCGRPAGRLLWWRCCAPSTHSARASPSAAPYSWTGPVRPSIGWPSSAPRAVSSGR